MKSLTNTATVKPLIGPFELTDGSDGVDATVDINCLATKRWILALYFWDRAELPYCANIARHIASALNHMAGHKNMVDPTEREWEQFFRAHPAPFHTVKVECAHEGSMVEIQSASGEALAYRKVWDSFEQAGEDARNICQALNLYA
ncbi:MAG: hypothetical protein Aurels2KO_39360 [Aureliella sp.]